MKYILSLWIVAALFACNNTKKSSTQNDNEITLIPDSAYSTELEGKKVSLYTLESGNGTTMQVTPPAWPASLPTQAFILLQPFPV